MKKRLFCLAAVISLIGMSGCGDKEPPIEAVPEADPVEELVPTEEEPVILEEDGREAVDPEVAALFADTLVDMSQEVQTVSEEPEEEISYYGTYTGTYVMDADWMRARWSEDYVKDSDKVEIPITVILEENENDPYSDYCSIRIDMISAYEKMRDLRTNNFRTGLTDALKQKGYSTEAQLDEVAKSSGFKSFDDMVNELWGDTIRYYDSWIEKEKEWLEDPNTLEPEYLDKFIIQIRPDYGTIIQPSGDVVFTINKDGTLTGTYDKDLNGFDHEQDIEYTVRKR